MGKILKKVKNFEKMREMKEKKTVGSREWHLGEPECETHANSSASPRLCVRLFFGG